MRRLVLPLLILVSRVAFAQSLSPEVPLTSGAVAASAEQSRRPRIVRNGDHQLVVWDAYGHTRWVVLDSNGGIVNRGVEESLFLRDAIAAGDGFFILCDGYPDNMMVILDRDGAVRKEVVVPRSSDQTMAWNGSRLLVAGFYGDAYLLDANANVATGPLTLPEIAPSTFIYNMAATPSEFGVVLQNLTTTYLARLSPGGSVIGVINLAPAMGGPASYDRPAIATDGTSFFVAWRFNDSLQGAIVTNGAVAHGFTIADRGVTGFPHAAWNGTDYAVTYEMSADVVENRVSAGGSVSARETIAATPRDERYPDVSGSTVVFERDTPCSRAETAIIATSGGHETLLSTGVPSEITPSVAATKETFFAAYLERSDLVRVRTTFGDFPVDDVSQSMDAVATDGEGFLVVAVDACGVVRAARFTSGGPGAAFEVGRDAQTGTRPFVMWNGSEFVALWENHNPSQVMAAPLDRDGRPLEGPRGLTPAIVRGDSFVSVASYSFTLVPNGGEYLLVWENYRYSDYPFYTDPPPTIEVRVRHVSASLHAIGDAPVITNGYLPYAATNGTDTVLVWSWEGKLHAGRLTPNGDLASDQALGEHAAVDVTPIVSAGNEFVVAAGALLARLDRDGAPHWVASMPADETAITWNGSAIKLLYARAQRVYERDVINPLPRRRGVIH